jgi:hypothetical protein
MGWLKKKNDPLSDKARSLNAQIATLEAQIKRLDTQLQRPAAQPRLRSTALPRGAAAPQPASPATASPAPPPASGSPEPIFEDVDQAPLQGRTDADNAPAHYNELGVRKYDLPALLDRIRNALRGPRTANPKLVSYLAAGGIQGLRPLRKEKRVARNRFIAFAIVLFLLLFGIFWMWFGRH